MARCGYQEVREDLAVGRCIFVAGHEGDHDLLFPPSAIGDRWPLQEKTEPERSCRVCGCTDNDCRQCIERAGHACFWLHADLCSICSTFLRAGWTDEEIRQGRRREPQIVTPGLLRALELVEQAELTCSDENRGELEILGAKLRAQLSEARESPEEIRVRRLVAATRSWTDLDIERLSRLALEILMRVARAFSLGYPLAQECEKGSQTALSLLAGSLQWVYDGSLAELVHEGDVIDRAMGALLEALPTGAPVMIDGEGFPAANPAAESEEPEGTLYCLWCHALRQRVEVAFAPEGTAERKAQEARDAVIPGFTFGHLRAQSESDLCPRCYLWAVEVSHHPERAVWALSMVEVLRGARRGIWQAAARGPVSDAEVERFDRVLNALVSDLISEVESSPFDAAEGEANP